MKILRVGKGPRSDECEKIGFHGRGDLEATYIDDYNMNRCTARKGHACSKSTQRVCDLCNNQAIEEEGTAALRMDGSSRSIIFSWLS